MKIMATDATREGVTDEQKLLAEQEDMPTNPLDRRQALLESLAQSVQAERVKEMTAAGQEAPEPFTEGKEAEKPAEEQPAGEETPVEKVKLVIDGEEREVPLSEVVDAGKRTLQKQEAADKRLEEATKLLREAKEVRETPPAKPDASKDSAPKPDAEKAAKVAKLTQAIRYGADDEAANAALELLELGATKGPNLDDAMSAMEARLDAKQTSQKIFDQFKTDFPQITGNQRLLNFAGQIVDEKVQAKGGTYTDYSTYQAAAKEVMDLFGVKPEEKKPVADLSEKEAKKKEASSSGVKPAQGRSPAGEVAEPDKSASDIVMDMKRRRGQL
jgi:hypothetical protein